MTTQKEKKKSADAPAKPDLNFEQALDRLEAIVSEMEDGELELETMISRFEEGRRHLKFCSAKLNEVERRIEMLVKKDDEITLEPFDESVAKDEHGSTVGRDNVPKTTPAASDEGELPF